MAFSKLSSCLVLLTTISAGVATAQEAPLSEKDRNVIRSVDQGNIEQIELGRLAQQKANHPRVKEFGKRMVDDHMKLKDEIHRLASSAGIVTATTVSPECQEMINQLSSLTGNEFDRHYILLVMSDENKMVADLKRHLAVTQNQGVRELINKTLPVLEGHVRDAENVAREMGLSPENGTVRPEHPETENGNNNNNN